MIDPVQLTADMLKIRDAYRFMYQRTNSDYEAAIRETRQIIRGLSKDAGVPIAKAALMMGNKMSANGHDPSIVIAAFVEECEDKTK